jgi:long-subunit acyl-CoA synthetase (AMP-forming)
MALCNLTETAKTNAAENIKDELKKLLAEVNKKLEHHEQLSRLIVLPEEWTIANGLLTPTLKIKRKMIDASFGDRYDSWSRAGDMVVFA